MSEKKYYLSAEKIAKCLQIIYTIISQKKKKIVLITEWTIYL